MAYRCFVRDWWKPNPSWPNGREPYPGAPKAYPRHNGKAAVFDTEEEAREFCREYNDTHDPGPMSRKAEYTEI